jgi:omega-6 fatty acid desaturase (delta-12 desaturase)
LTHTDVDIPYFDEDNWEHVKGSFQTIERPFGAFLDFMHHGIGSTHVAHHINPQIPHYNCWEAKEILRKEYP